MKQMHILDSSDDDVTDAMREEMRELWEEYGFGNDSYYTVISDYDVTGIGTDNEQEKYPSLRSYIKDNNLTLDQVLIHYWW